MPDFTITATVNSKKITYKDEKGAVGPDKAVAPAKTISWISDSGDIDIQFTGNPFTNSGPHLHANVNQSTTPATLGNYASGTTFKYAVRITDHKTGKLLAKDDPRIIFGDPLQGESLRLDETLTSLGKSAGQAWQGLLNELKTTAGLKRDPDAEFFPGGITNIQVEVTVPVLAGLASISVSITVSGPDATVLSGAHTEKG